MNGPQNMASYGMTIQGLLGKDLLSLSMPEFKDDLKNPFKDDVKSSFSVKNLKDLGNNQGSDPTSAYLGGYQKVLFKCSIYKINDSPMNYFSLNDNFFQAPNFGTVQSAYPLSSILLGCLTSRMCSLKMTSRYKDEDFSLPRTMPQGCLYLNTQSKKML